MQIEVASGKRWLSLAEDLRSHICVALLDQRADAAWLSVLEDMHRQEPNDPRLTTVCVKALCDHREYLRAFAVLRRAIVDRSGQTFLKGPDTLMKDLDQYSKDMQFMLRLKFFIDIENRKETLPRPISDEVERTFDMACDVCKAALPGLSQEDRARLLLCLLDLAEATDCERCSLEAAEMFIQSIAKDDVVAYAGFIRRLQKASVYPRISPRRTALIAQFNQHVEKKTVNEKTFLRLFEKETGHRLDRCMDGTEADAVRVISSAINFANRIGIGSKSKSVEKAARSVLQSLQDPNYKFDLCINIVCHYEGDLRLFAATLFQQCVSHVKMTPSQTLELIRTFLFLNDGEQLRALHARGLIESANLPAYYLSDLYGTMGLFGEGAEKMKQARHAAVVEFSKAAEIAQFDTITSLVDPISEFEFLHKCSQILNSVPQPKTPRGLLVMVAKGAHEVNRFPILALKELKERGYVVVPLVAASLQYQPTGIREIDEIADQLNVGLNYARWSMEAIAAQQPRWTSQVPIVGRFFRRNHWVWDPEHYEISYAGVNAYWGIREDLCCHERRYSVDFSSPRYAAYLADIRKRIELWELVLRKICAIGKTHRIPVRIMLQYIHLTTHYYCRKYVEAASAEQDIGVIHCAVGYETYFANFVTDEATTICVQDMTRHADLASGFFAPRDWFERHYQALSDENRDRLVDAVEHVITQQRVQRDQSTDASERIAFFKSERQRGRRIVGLFGKVLFDQEMPRGDGPAHKDMRDWFDHSIDIARRNPNILLVIKPHPHELREEIALYSSERLKDWLPNATPSNVHFLGNNELNLFELAETLDLALMWHGTSALEDFGVLRIPTILAAYYGEINCPVGHVVPKSKKDYEQLVLNYSSTALSIDTKRRSAVLIDYFRHKDVSTPYRYTYRGFTNRYIQLRWFQDELTAYESRGDENVTVLADRIVGLENARLS